MKVGLIRERKLPPDVRVALTPQQALLLSNDPSSFFEVILEKSPDRIFPDEAYTELGIKAVDRISGCDLLLGIKEVPEDDLVPDTTYMFFSHTIKEQPYNQKMFQTMAARQITLIDYECLVWPEAYAQKTGQRGRILGFGRWAGIVGAYNGFLTWGRKTGQYELKPAYQCTDLNDLKAQLDQITIPSVKIALTGEGRVGGGALEILEYLNIRRIDPEAITGEFGEPVYSVFGYKDLFRRKNGQPWDARHFYENHFEYEGCFRQYMNHIDLLINGLYWEDDMDQLFTKEDTRDPGFRTKVIADISCDVEGSVPITMRSTTIDDPTFGWDPVLQQVTAPFLENTIDVMAVTNLPAELPASASEDFGDSLLQHVLPLFKNDPDGILEQATILDKGRLTEKYSYLRDYLAGK